MRTHKHILPVVFLFIFMGFQKLSAQEKLSLEQAKKMAILNNHKIKKATVNIEASKAAKASAYTKNKPSLEASVMGLTAGSPLNTLIPRYMANTSLAINQAIYQGGKISATKKISNETIDLYTSQKELTNSDVLLDVERTYWQIVNVKSKIELAKKYKESLKALLNDLTNSYNAGIIYKNDLLRVQTQLNEALLSLTKANDNLSILKLKMAQLIGMDSINSIETDIITAETNIVDKGIPMAAIQNRPEIKMLKSSLKIEQLQTKILNADRKPSINLSINGIYANGKHANFSNKTNHFASYYATLNVKIPIFDWGGRKQKVKEQKFKVDAQKIELQNKEELLKIEITQAYLQLKQDKKSVEINEKSLEQADENLRLNQDQFKAGTIVGKDVLEAQVLWQEAYSNLIDAKALLQISKANYKKSIGELN